MNYLWDADLLSRLDKAVLGYSLGQRRSPGWMKTLAGELLACITVGWLIGSGFGRHAGRDEFYLAHPAGFVVWRLMLVTIMMGKVLKLVASGDSSLNFTPVSLRDIYLHFQAIDRRHVLLGLLKRTCIFLSAALFAWQDLGHPHLLSLPLVLLVGLTLPSITWIMAAGTCHLVREFYLRLPSVGIRWSGCSIMFNLLLLWIGCTALALPGLLSQASPTLVQNVDAIFSWLPQTALLEWTAGGPVPWVALGLALASTLICLRSLRWCLNDQHLDELPGDQLFKPAHLHNWRASREKSFLQALQERSPFVVAPHELPGSMAVQVWHRSNSSIKHEDELPYDDEKGRHTSRPAPANQAATLDQTAAQAQDQESFSFEHAITEGCAQLEVQRLDQSFSEAHPPLSKLVIQALRWSGLLIGMTVACACAAHVIQQSFDWIQASNPFIAQLRLVDANSQTLLFFACLPPLVCLFMSMSVKAAAPFNPLMFLRNDKAPLWLQAPLDLQAQFKAFDQWRLFCLKRDAILAGVVFTATLLAWVLLSIVTELAGLMHWLHPFSYLPGNAIFDYLLLFAAFILWRHFNRVKACTRVLGFSDFNSKSPSTRFVSPSSSLLWRLCRAGYTATMLIPFAILLLGIAVIHVPQFPNMLCYVLAGLAIIADFLSSMIVSGMRSLALMGKVDFGS